MGKTFNRDNIRTEIERISRQMEEDITDPRNSAASVLRYRKSRVRSLSRRANRLEHSDPNDR